MKTENKISETPYYKAWHSYKSNPNYYHAVNIMSENGMKQPYIDNILEDAFSLGWGFCIEILLNKKSHENSGTDTK